MPDIATPRIAAAYIRVSTEEQTEQSPESQLVEIRKYAAQRGFILPDEFIFVDPGISGKRTENRPAFQQMIGTAKQKPPPFDTILLWKFSRFARNQEESIVYKALLRKQCGVDVVSVSEPLPGGMFSSLIERIIEWFDEFYSIRLAEEVKRSMTVMATKGELMSHPPFGYRIKVSDDGQKMFEPAPGEAELIPEIYRRFVAGDGAWGIARWLNSLGVKTRRGGTFENKSIKYIIQNPTYLGKYRWTPSGRITRNGLSSPDTIISDAPHPALVSRELWDQAQLVMEKTRNTRTPKSRPSQELKDWLGGAVRCSECGGTLIFSKPHFFKCNNYVHGKCTTLQHIDIDILHEAVIERLRHDIVSAKTITPVIHHTSQSRTGELPAMKVHLADLQRRQSRLLDAYLSGAMDLTAYQKMNKKLSEEIENAEQTVKDLQAIVPSDATPLLKESIRRALEIIEAPDATIIEKNNAIREVTERIVFNKAQKTLDITYRIFL